MQAHVSIKGTSLTTAHLRGEVKFEKGHSSIQAHASAQPSLTAAISITESVINNFARNLCSVGCWRGDAGGPWKVPEIQRHGLLRRHISNTCISMGKACLKNERYVFVLEKIRYKE